MTDLTRYGHDFNGFLTTEYSNFRANSKGSYQFRVDSPTLELEVGCDVGIFPSSSSSEVIVEIDCDDNDLKNFNVSRQGSSVIVKQENSGGGNIFIGDSISVGGNVTMPGVSISGGGNSTMFVNGKKIEVRGGKTYVNGVCIDGVGGNTAASKEPKIRIYAPQLSSIEAEMNGSTNLASLVPFLNADVKIEGHAKV
ncbi:MAG: hypothetical protein WCJ33_06110, partial [Pseudomonadota bacterium]